MILKTYYYCTTTTVLKIFISPVLGRCTGQPALSDILVKNWMVILEQIWSKVLLPARPCYTATTGAFGLGRRR